MHRSRLEVTGQAIDVSAMCGTTSRTPASRKNRHVVVVSKWSARVFSLTQREQPTMTTRYID
jgi:hypothetical protein